jgi:sugar lactone lactonase YvrE
VKKISQLLLKIWLNIGVFFLFLNANAQAPSISYSTPNYYNIGVSITPLTPVNSGGTVGSYGAISAFVYAGNHNALAVDNSGNVVIINSGTNTLTEYNSSGTVITANYPTTGYSGAQGAIIDGNGNLYVSNYSANTVTKTTTAGVVTTISVNSPIGLTMDSSNNIYVASNATGIVYKIASGSATLSSFLTGFSSPWGLAMNTAGDLYVSQTSDNTIYKISNGSTTHTSFATGFNSPRFLALDPSGNLYVSDCYNNAIKKITTGGTVTTLITSGLVTPDDQVFDQSGNLYISNFGGGDVVKSAASGYTISATLPAGLSFSKYSGVISGTPTVSSPLTSYTVTATNGNGSSNFVLNIAVITAPTAPGVSSCTGNTATITASGGAPSGGTYNWYAAASGGTALQSSASTTYTTPALTTSTTYYVSYKVGGVESARTSVTVTVTSPPVISQYPSSASSNLTLSLPFTGNANDVSGNSNNGTVQNGATLTQDRYNTPNSAYSFNGSSQFISTANSLSAPSTFSISTWFKTTTTSGGAIVGFNSSQTGSGTNYDRAVYMNNAGLIYFGVSNGTYIQTINTTTSYNDGKWHNVVATFSSTTGEKLYIDGALTVYNTSYVGYTGYTGFWRVANSNFNGNWASTPSSNYFAGSIDDVAIYNREVTSTEVYSLNGAGSVPFCPNGTLTLQANTVASATYAWTGPNGFTSSLQNPTISNATSTNIGTYTVTVTNATGCSSQATATTSLSSVPTSTFSLPAAAYPNTSTTVTYSGTDPSTSTFTWNFGSGTVISGSGMGPYQVQWASAGTQTVTLTVTNANGCSSSTTTHTININSTSWYSTYVYRKKITFDQTQISGTQANFPVLVKIVDADLVYTPGLCTNKVQSATLNDLAFVDGTAPQSAELPYEIDTYDGTTGTLLVWVQVPSFSSSGAGNSLYYYFGSTAPPAHAAASSTWASDYKAVYHFNEKTLNSAVGGVKESTSNASNATTSNMTAASLTTGQIGGAYTFSNSSISTGSNLDVLGDHTLSAWVYTNNTGLDQKVMTNQNASNYYGYKLGSYFGAMETENQTAGYGYSATRGSTPIGYIAANTWYYVQGVASGTQLSVYVNGVQYATTTVTIGSTTTGSTFYIGVGESGNQYYWSGVIDEVRVSTVAKSSSWIQTEYNNQRNPASTGSNHFISSIANIEYNTTNFNAGYSPGSLIYTWTGASGTSVTTAANWNITSVTPNVATTAPSSQYASIAIPGGLSGYPILNASFSVYSLTMASGSQFNLNGNSLIMGCDIVNTSNGQILYSNNTSSTINWNGALATQNYYGSTISGTGQTGNMIVNNTAAGTVNIASGKFDIYNTLTITKGNLVVGTSPATLTLKSTSTLTASVAAIPSPYTITGTVNVERYLQGGAGYRGYRLVSSPVYAGSVNSNNVYSINYLINNIILTGYSGTTGGFDKAGNPTLYLFREDLTPYNKSFTGGNFWGISTINNSTPYNYYLNSGSTSYNLPVGSGYMMFFRGDRTAASLATETTAGYVPVAATVTASGSLTQGQVIAHEWYTPTSPYLNYTGSGGGTNAAVRGFNLLGNPYASSIDWEQYNNSSTTTGIYATSNVSNTVYELNPLTYNYDTYQQGGIYTNNGTRTIASGQGFFVLATNSSNPQLIFNETAKTSLQNTGAKLFMSTKAELASLNSTTVDQHLRIRLSVDSINTDDTYIGFKSTANVNYIVNEDALYIQGNGKVSLASFSGDHQPLAINKQPFPDKIVRIPLKVGAVADGLYTLKRTEMAAIPQLYEIWLMDAYKKDSLDMRANDTYAFNLALADTNSYGSRRFTLVIRQNPALGVHLLSFTAAQAKGGALVTWTTENEANYTNFEVQRSTDGGVTFTTVGGFGSSAVGSYNFTDTNLVKPGDAYRLKITDLNGAVTYSNVVTIMYANTGNNVTNTSNTIIVYPNPAKSVLNLQIIAAIDSNSAVATTQSIGTGGTKQTSSAANTVYAIKIVNNLGLVIKSVTTAQQNWQTDVNSLVPGTYIIQVLNNKDNSLVGRTAFVKL